MSGLVYNAPLASKLLKNFPPQSLLTFRTADSKSAEPFNRA